MNDSVSLTGRCFASLVVIGLCRPSSQLQDVWFCECVCGEHRRVSGRDLLSGRIKSCGCAKIKHNQSYKHKTKTYRSWAAMKGRCYNHNNKKYASYGARGIKVTQNWLGEHGFENFYRDMGSCPDGRSLNRIDNNGNYEPGNCEWATPKIQARNTRGNTNHVVSGVSMCEAAWEEKLGLKRSVINSRIHQLGWCVDDAVLTPARRNYKFCRNRLFSYDGQSLTLTGWAKKTGIKFNTLYMRLRRGWSFDKAVSSG